MNFKQDTEYYVRVSKQMSPFENKIVKQENLLLFLIFCIQIKMYPWNTVYVSHEREMLKLIGGGRS